MACSTDADCVYNKVDYGPCVLDWHHCTKGMAYAARHNLAAMNDGVNWSGARIVLDGLRNDVPECFSEFSRRLGYRYVLTEAAWPASVAAGGVLDLDVTLRNDGFARLYNPRAAYLAGFGHEFHETESAAGSDILILNADRFL